MPHPHPQEVWKLVKYADIWGNQLVDAVSRDGSSPPLGIGEIGESWGRIWKWVGWPRVSCWLTPHAYIRKMKIGEFGEMTGVMLLRTEPKFEHLIKCNRSFVGLWNHLKVGTSTFNNQIAINWCFQSAFDYFLTMPMVACKDKCCASNWPWTTGWLLYESTNLR